MVDLGVDGSLLGNESGISLEEGNDEVFVVVELRFFCVFVIFSLKVIVKVKFKLNFKEIEI